MSPRVGLHVLVLAMFMVLLGTTVSAAPQPGRVHFTTAGDFAQTTNTGLVLDAIKTSGSDFTMTLGDMSYGTTGNEQVWCDFVKQRVGQGYPFEMLSGNHESNGINGNINDFSACLPNQLPGAVGTYGRQYYVDVPAEDPIVRYIMISPGLIYPGSGGDQTWSYASGTARYQWTANAIDGARSASIPWVVVGMHKPCINLGTYNCDSGPDLFNLLLSKKVDLVLSGHEHSYQRSHQLGLRTGCPTLVPNPPAPNPACIVDSDSAFTAGAGTVSMVVGTGGQLLYDVNAADPEAAYVAASSGKNKVPTFGALDVVATDTSFQASFLDASGGGFADAFSISRGTSTNTPPQASFTSSCVDLTCTFDATGSTDPDGTIGSYTWDFGDGTQGSGATATHAYATPRSYSVQLTVTDDAGASGSATGNVSPTAPPATTYAADQFGRTTTGSWGSATTGGAWTTSCGACAFAVAGGVGTMRANAGATPTAYLQGVSTANVDLQLAFGLDKLASGSGAYFSADARRVPGQGSYVAKTSVSSTGAVALSLVRLSATGAETTIQGGVTVSGLTYAVGDLLNLRVQATGGSPTTIRAKVWKVGTPEPAAWQRLTTDTTAGLQTAGQVGIRGYVSSGATNTPITFRVDNLIATTP